MKQFTSAQWLRQVADDFDKLQHHRAGMTHGPLDHVRLGVTCANELSVRFREIADELETADALANKTFPPSWKRLY